MIRVLFVCLGNICRSPTAEGIFRKLVQAQGLSDEIDIASAGTGGWHVGQPPDRRAQETARERGIDLSALRGRQATPGDFNTFDYVVAMDSSNYQNLAAICPPGEQDKLHMCLSFAPEINLVDVPDPYYEDGFDRVFDMIEAAGRGLLAEIRRAHGL